MPRDIFPDLGVPTLYVAQPYGGMDPAQMEGYLTYYYEYHFLYITGIEHVESKSIQGAALIKLQFHPGTNMASAMAETVSYVNRARAFMPPGTIPPFIMRFDAGSVPVGQLVFSSDDPNVQLKDLQDAALNRVRPRFATLPGVSAPPPFGGSPRAIVINVDPDRLRSLNMSPDEVVSAVARGNLITPSGNVRIGDLIPMVPINSVAPDARTFMDIPIRVDGTRTTYVRDVGTVADAADIQTAFALVNGKRTVYMPVTKRADASTLSVVNLVKANLPEFQKVLPDNVKVSYEFDQSPYVVRAIEGLAEEGGLGAILTGLMVLLFLRDWRSALVVLINIPISLVAAAIALWIGGQTINIMTLGGLALAVGILVDEATVTIENVHTHLARGASAARAASDATSETTVPRLMAMLSILAVFIPAFFMQGPARSLFVPLALAVGFSMVASYILSSTLVPVLSVWLVRSGHGAANSAPPGLATRALGAYRSLSSKLVRFRWIVVPAYLAAAAALIWLLTPSLGREIFPVVDTGQFTVRLRASTGTRIEATEALARKTLAAINKEVGGDDAIQISIGLVGVHPGAYPVNLIHLWTSGPEEAVLQVQLNPKYAVRVEDLKERLRRRLPQEFPGLRFSFEPSDIVSRVMSFGSPTPVEVAVSGANFQADQKFARQLQEELARIPSLRDLQFQQELDYPAIRVDFDRERAGAMGISADQVARSLTEATSSSRLIAANYWADPRSGVAYQVQVQVPILRMNSVDEIKNLPIAGTGASAAGGAGQMQIGQVANVSAGAVLGQYDRYNMTRMVSLGANIHGEDLGRVAAHVEAAIDRVAPRDPSGKRKLPEGVTSVDIRGQVPPMGELFDGLTKGLLVAIAVIFLLLAANFQSFRLSFAVILTMPAVIAGVLLALRLTHTTLNIQSFMGAIMAVGVAVANAIMLITFAERSRFSGTPTRDAAVEGAAGRVRPILMTSCAMIAGMLPMALGLGNGGAQTAPLGRAVIGGLAAATVATLVILPAIFATLQRDQTRRTASIDPDDPHSPRFQPAQQR
jgi:multidrug efflux pump subunit AcrB